MNRNIPVLPELADSFSIPVVQTSAGHYQQKSHKFLLMEKNLKTNLSDHTVLQNGSNSVSVTRLKLTENWCSK